MRLELKLLPAGQLPTAPDSPDAVDARFDSDDEDSADEGSSYGEAFASRTESNSSLGGSPPTPVLDGSKEGEAKEEEHRENEPTPSLSFSGASERLHFNGTFANTGAGMQPHRSIRGTVSMTKEGFVHW
jgi:hypothetical protein